MTYMSFLASCSYCCLANLLEVYGIHTTDRQIALDMALPYLFVQDANGYCAGAMIQSPAYFDLYLNPKGLSFAENACTREETLAFMDTHIPCMVGIAGEFGKHAMVYLGRQAEAVHLLNPHRKGDGQPDHMDLADEELTTRLSNENMVGYLETCAPKAGVLGVELERSLKTMDSYEAEVSCFCSVSQTEAAVRESLNTLFRPFALDLLAMMELIGENALAARLRIFRDQAMAMFRAGSCKPDTIVDMDNFRNAAALYSSMIRSQIS